jgi:FtsP/CotA-like multicopper oxidase with cupredoxin domain
MDIFQFDGFLGDRMCVNMAYRPYFEVEARKYRFRVLNASVSRFFKYGLSDGTPIVQIANDGNLLPYPVPQTVSDEQGIAERYDWIIDFSRYKPGQKVQLVNVTEHSTGKKPTKDLSVADALAGKSQDPCVGAFLEFRIVRYPATPDLSQIPAVMIPNPDLSAIPVSRERVFEFGSGANQPLPASDPAAFTTGAGGQTGPWGVAVDGGKTLNASFGRISAAPKFGTREVWTLKNAGGGWDHPIHIHFEEGRILQRTDQLGNDVGVPAWEGGRKDVYRLRPGGSVKITLQFRDWGGMYMEHCHNTVHEDNAMLVRWEINGAGEPFLNPLPTPIATPQGVTFNAPDDIAPTAF